MIDTRGRRALEKLLETKTQDEVAAATSVVQSSVSDWVTGESRPNDVRRSMLRIAFGIAEELWLTDDERRALERAKKRAAKTGTDDG